MKVLLIIISTLIGEEYLYVSNDYAYKYEISTDSGLVTRKIVNQTFYDLNFGLAYKISDNLEYKSKQENISQNGEGEIIIFNNIIQVKYEKYLDYDAKLEYHMNYKDKRNTLLLKKKIAIPLLEKYLIDDNKIKQLPGVGYQSEEPFWFTAELEILGYQNDTLFSEMKFLQLKSIQEITVDENFFKNLINLKIRD